MSSVSVCHIINTRNHQSHVQSDLRWKNNLNVNEKVSYRCLCIECRRTHNHIRLGAHTHTTDYCDHNFHICANCLPFTTTLSPLMSVSKAMVEQHHTTHLKKSDNMEMRILSPEKSKVHALTGHSVEIDSKSGERKLRLKVEWSEEDEETNDGEDFDDEESVESDGSDESYIDVETVESEELFSGEENMGDDEETEDDDTTNEVCFSLEPIELMWEDIPDMVLDYSMDNTEVHDFIQEKYPDHDEDSEDQLFIIPNIEEGAETRRRHKRMTRSCKDKVFLPGL